MESGSDCCFSQSYSCNDLGRPRTRTTSRVVVFFEEEPALSGSLSPPPSPHLQVLDSCQKQEASGGAGRGGPGPLSCNTSDVLSGIMHVISRGCLRRHVNNPHIVEFLPEDPPTPQKGNAHLSFGARDRGDSLADIRCDATSDL